MPAPGQMHLDRARLQVHAGRLGEHHVEILLLDGEVRIGAAISDGASTAVAT